MTYVNAILTAVFDTIYAVLGLLPSWLSLIVLSGLVGLLAVVVVRYCSDQTAIGRVKDDIKANMLALKLFKDELPVVLKAQGRLILAGLKMQYYMLPPLAVMFVPFVLVAAQMGLRYQWRPLAPNERTTLTLALTDDADPRDLDVTVEAPPSVTVSHRVRAHAGRKTVDWYVSAGEPGTYSLALECGDVEYTKRLTVGDKANRVSPRRPGSGLLDRILYPAEAPFGTDSPVRSIAIAYPPRDSWFHGADWWIVWFVVLSIVAALALRPVIGARF